MSVAGPPSAVAGGRRKSVAHSASFISTGSRGAGGDPAGGASPGEHALHRVERSIHVLLFALTDRSANKKHNSFFFLILLPLALAAADFFQLIGLTLSTGSAWHPDATLWIQRLSAFFSINFLAGWTVFCLTFWGSVAGIVAMLGTAAFAAYSFQRNAVRIFPIRVVRFLAQVFQTALYIPALEILSQEISVVGPSPASMLWAGSQRIGWQWIMYASVSGAVLALFIPFMLVLALVYTDTNPLSRNLESCAHGRVAFLYTVVRTALVFATRFLSQDVTNVCVAVGIGAAFLAQVLVLPNYHAFMNRYSAGLFLCACWFAVASLALSLVGSPTSDARFYASAVGLAMSLPAFLAGYKLAGWRHRQVVAKGRRIAVEGVSPAAAEGLLSLLVVAPPAPPVGLSVRAAGNLTARNRKQSVAFNSLGASALTRSPKSPAVRYLPGPDAAGVGTPAEPSPARVLNRLTVAVGGELGPGEERPGTVRKLSDESASLDLAAEPAARRLVRAVRERARLFWLSFEVEVAARAVYGSRANRTAEEALEAVDGIYRAGYTLFPESAYVRLAHSVYIAIHRNNPMGALQVQKEAWALRPAFDVRFALVAMKREFEQRTASTNLGEAKGMNFISVLEFKRLHESAVQWHNESIMQLRALWKALARTRLTESALSTVPRKLELIDKATRTAGEAYRSLLAKYPNSKLLLREYGAFLLGIGNDPDLAQLHFLAAEEIEEQEADNEAGGGGGEKVEQRSAGSRSSISKKLQQKYMQKAGAKGGQYAASANGSASSTDFAARARSEAQRLQSATQDIKHVQRVRWGILFGLAVIIALTSVFFINIQTVLKQMSDTIARITASSSQMRRLLEYCFLSRSMNLYAVAGDEHNLEEVRGELRDAADRFAADMRGLYLGFRDPPVPPSSAPAVVALWTEPVTKIVRYLKGPPPTRVEQGVSFYGASSYMNGVLRDLYDRPADELREIVASEGFHFVQENAARSLFDAAYRMVGLYEDEIFATTAQSKMVLAGILAAILLALLVLAVFLLRPAFEKVRKSMRGVNEIIAAMPPHVRKAMYTRYATMKRVDDPNSGTDSDPGEPADEPAKPADLSDDEPAPAARPGPALGLSSLAPPSGRGGPREAKKKVKAEAKAEAEAEAEGSDGDDGDDESDGEGAKKPAAKDRVHHIAIAAPPSSDLALRVSAWSERGEDAHKAVVVPIDGDSASGGGRSPEAKERPFDFWATFGNAAHGPGALSVAALLRDDDETEDGGATPAPPSVARLRRRAPHEARVAPAPGPGPAALPEAERSGDEAAGAPRPLKGSLKHREGEASDGGEGPAAGAAHERRGSTLSEGTDRSEGEKKKREKEKKGGAGDIISTLTKRVGLAFLAIAAIAAANFAVCFLFMDQTQYVAPYIREAGKRWALVTEVHLWAREAYVNDGLAKPLPALLRRLHAAATELDAAEAGIVHGNASARLLPSLARDPAQDQLLFEERCLHVDPAACLPDEIPNMASVTSGLDYMMQVLVHSAFEVLQDFAYFDPAGRVDEGRLGELGAAGPQPDYDIAGIKARSAGLRQILAMDESGNLDDALTRSMALYQQMADGKIGTVRAVESYTLAFNIVFLVGLYLFVFRSVVARLSTECTRTTQFVAMLPASVIAQVPALHKYGEAADEAAP